MKISYRLSAAAFLICVAATSPGCTRENNTAPAVAVDDFKTTKEQQIEMRPLVQVAVESRTDNGQSPDDTRMLSITSVQVALGTLKGQKLRDVRDFLDFIGVASRLTGRLAPDQESVVVDVEKTLTNLDADPEEELLIHVIATNKTAESPARGEREYHPLKFADLHIIAVIDADATGARSAGAQGLYHLTENNLESLTVRTAPVRTKEFKDVIVEYGVRNEGGQGAARYSRTLVFALLDGKLAELLDTYGDDDPSEATPGDLAGLRMEIGTDVPATATWFDAATSNVIFRKSLNTAIGAYTLMPELSPEDIELESKTSDGSKLAKPVCPEGSGQKVCGRWADGISFPMPTNGLVWQISCSKHVNAGRYSWALASCLRATATPENADKKFADTVRSQIAGITRAVNDYNLLSFFSSFGGVVSVADGTPEFSGIVLIDESATGQGVVNPDGSITNRLVQDLLGGGYRDILSTCKMARAHDGLYEFCEPWQRNNAFSPETQKKLDETAAKIRRGR